MYKTKPCFRCSMPSDTPLSVLALNASLKHEPTLSNTGELASLVLEEIRALAQVSVQVVRLSDATLPVGLGFREAAEDDWPDLVTKIAHICLMGGAAGEGNITPSAEFNAWVDPEAADLVYRSGVPVTMIGLDVTHKAILWDAEREAMAAAGGGTTKLMCRLLGFYQGFHRRVYGWDGGPIHDAVAVAHVAHPGLVTTVRANVVVELSGEFTRGRTVVDLRTVTGREPNAEVGMDIDRERFVGIVRDAFAAFD